MENQIKKMGNFLFATVKVKLQKNNFTVCAYKYGKSDWYIEDVFPIIPEDNEELYGKVTSLAVNKLLTN